MIATLLLVAAVAHPPHRAVAVAAERLARLDSVIEGAIERHELPGAVVLVGDSKKTFLRRAWGSRALQPVVETMTVDTIFDVASLTKVVATAPSIMLLVEEGKLRLADPVVRYIPEFGEPGSDRARVTIEQLLTHRAGLAPDDPLELYSGTAEEIFARKYRQPLEHPPGERFVYSDVGYEVLGELVRRVSGERLDVFAAERIFRPLGMKDTAFHPLPPGEGRGEGALSSTVSRIAPTERREGRWMRGEVHDPRAYALGGVAGHAGLFSTADDLARFCRMILDGGTVGRTRVLSPLAVDALTRPRFTPDGDVRSLGFDVSTAYSSPRGDLFPPGSFGHTGFTGTSLWIDPASGVFVILLSNRVHPDGKGNVVRLRSLVASVVASAIGGDVGRAARALESKMPAPVRRVAAGIDVLAEERFRAIAGKRVALLTNATGRARDGRSSIEVLASPEAKAAGVSLVRIFSPEHGIATDADEKVSDQVEPRTGVPIRSLYGETRRPSEQDLAGLDAVLVDLQDVGTRFYTYIATAGYLLEAAAKAHLPFFVLDRPDPIGGVEVEGAPADADRLSFTAYAPIPVRIGMTLGELMALVDGEKGLGADLHVVRMRGWSRELWYDETGLEWVNPSPNMRSLAAAALYPGVGLLETTNVSVGRGTDTPFEVLGAPWIDGSRLAQLLSARAVPGVRFSPLHFTPKTSVFAGERCGGVRIDVVERSALRPVALGMEIAVALRDLYPMAWDRRRFIDLVANADVVRRLETGQSAPAIVASWQGQLQAFLSKRAKYLLY
jgi:uncharacterized protein YbbC (DUF1343 family)